MKKMSPRFIYRDLEKTDISDDFSPAENLRELESKIFLSPSVQDKTQKKTGESWEEKKEKAEFALLLEAISEDQKREWGILPSQTLREKIRKIRNLSQKVEHLTFSGEKINPVLVFKNFPHLSEVTITDVKTLNDIEIPFYIKKINGKTWEPFEFSRFEKWWDEGGVKMVGDSNVVGFTRNAHHFNIQAKGGRKTQEMKEKLEITKKENILVIFGGGNDLGYEDCAVRIPQNIQDMVEKAFSENGQVHIIIGTVTPRGQYSARNAERVKKVNENIHQLYQELQEKYPEKIHFIDWHQELSCSVNPENYNPAFVRDDLVHANERGNQKIQSLLDQKFRKILGRKIQ